MSGLMERYRKEETKVIHGFAILDGRGRIWSGMVFPDEDGANMTAARCCGADARIVRAREVRWQDYRPGKRIPIPMRQILLEDE